MTHFITTHSMMSLSRMDLIVTLSITIHGISIWSLCWISFFICCNVKCHGATKFTTNCWFFSNFYGVETKSFWSLFLLSKLNLTNCGSKSFIALVPELKCQSRSTELEKFWAEKFKEREWTFYILTNNWKFFSELDMSILMNR